MIDFRLSFCIRLVVDSFILERCLKSLNCRLQIKLQGTPFHNICCSVHIIRRRQCVCLSVCYNAETVGKFELFAGARRRYRVLRSTLNFVVIEMYQLCDCFIRESSIMDPYAPK